MSKCFATAFSTLLWLKPAGDMRGWRNKGTSVVTFHEYLKLSCLSKKVVVEKPVQVLQYPFMSENTRRFVQILAIVGKVTFQVSQVYSNMI